MTKHLKKISKYTPSIFQGTLELSVAQGFSLTREHPYERAVLKSLVLVLGILSFGYVYFVGVSVLNIVARKEADAQTVKLQSAIASMEQQYFALSHEVDESAAYAIGLAPIAETHFVYRPGNLTAAETSAAATIASNGL